MAAECSHLGTIKVKTTTIACLRRVREAGGSLGPPAAVPRVRQRRLLRFLKKQARDEALSRDEASTDPFDRAARILGLVLRG
jgi:hypothetical protein